MTTTRWWLCVTILHLQQYSHRLNLFWFLHRRMEGCMRLMDWKICRRKLYRRYRWPCGLWRRSAAARPLRLRVQNSPGSWMFVCCECCVLSGEGLCDELITVPEESYWVGFVVVCDLESSRMRRPWPALGSIATRRKEVVQASLYALGL